MRWSVWWLGLGLLGCASEPGPNACRDRGTDGATASCLEPNLAPEHYVSEALRYFDTLDVTAPADSIPDYHDQVARWEWPPWLFLTGLGKEDMIDASLALRRIDPSTVPERDCRFFPTQPFARCYVVFEYEEGPCPIYEEFTFDALGRTTFIEAWSELPGRLPLAEGDRWGEDPGFTRLANRIPGLGRPEGGFDLESEAMVRASERDPEVADFAMRAADWRSAWARALRDAEPDFFARGCGWDTP
ncbi:MAG: hypothetical protein KC586_29935 [Myxococcales bacterium]|nr:hypothetical protein [Myxococcales bacterium]